MKIYTNRDNLIIEVPLKSRRYCPFTDTDKGEMDNIVGLVERNKGFIEVGFAYRIDMDYANKGDQNSDFFYKETLGFGDEEGVKKWEERCEELGIECWTMNLPITFDY